MAKKKEPKPPKAGKGGASGKNPKKSKVPRPVQGRGFAIFGLLALAPIALLLLKGRLDLEAAAQRAVIVLVGVMVLERVIAPLVLAVLNSGHKPEAETPEDPALTPADG
jgi:hypothetical protein